MTSLVWLRNDLRIHDNPALHHAAAARRGVVAITIFCAEHIERHATAPARLDFIRRHLSTLSTSLAQRNIPLRLEVVGRACEIAPRLLACARQEACSELYFNAEYPIDERERDRRVIAQLAAQGVASHVYHDRVVLAPGTLRNVQGQPYKIFSAFRRRWLQHLMTPAGRSSDLLRVLPAPAPQKVGAQSAPRDRDVMPEIGGAQARPQLSELWPVGEPEAHRRLEQFVDHGLELYHRQRDFPAIAGTSSLSPYLAAGVLSPRQCLAAALTLNGGEWDSGKPGCVSWINELIWREFYQHLVFDYPQLCRHQPMQSYTESFPWSRDRDLFERWCQGETGVPIVDAAMLQLKATGWMHNRLRMITAMFLTKNLQMDWRWGERYFMSQLIDGDFAANNGGWQWCASTGADAVPYFRIFNPVTQSRRFDPQGEFIRRYLPVLAHLDNKSVHQPPTTVGYPAPVVDLAASRNRTLALFNQIKAFRDA